MATVRFSKELIDNILCNARNKMEPAVTKARETKPDDSWGQIIYDILFLEVKPLIRQVPAEWFRTTSTLNIVRVGGERCGLEFRLAVPQPWPNCLVESDLVVSASAYGEGINLKHHLVWGEFHAEVVAYKERIKVATQRRDEFVEAVKEICTTYSTLAPAIKVWPPLWELVPDVVKDKHREVKEREKKKEEVKLEVDLGKLTALSTAAKLGV